MQGKSKGEKCVLETFMTAGGCSMRRKWGRKVIQTEKTCNKSIGCRNVWMEREREGERGERARKHQREGVQKKETEEREKRKERKKQPLKAPYDLLEHQIRYPIAKVINLLHRRLELYLVKEQPQRLPIRLELLHHIPQGGALMHHPFLIELVRNRALVPHQLLQPRAPIDVRDGLGEQDGQTLAVRHPAERVEHGDVRIAMGNPISHVVIPQERVDHLREIRRREKAGNRGMQLHPTTLIIVVRSRRGCPRRRLQPNTQNPQRANQRVLEPAHLLVRLGYEELDVRLPVLLASRVH